MLCAQRQSSEHCQNYPRDQGAQVREIHRTCPLWREEAWQNSEFNMMDVRGFIPGHDDPTGAR